MAVEKVMYADKVHISRSRERASRGFDGDLVVRLSKPGAADNGSNSEQLFATGLSACFMGAAGRAKIRLRGDRAIEAEGDLVTADGNFIQNRLHVGRIANVAHMRS